MLRIVLLGLIAGMLTFDVSAVRAQDGRDAIAVDPTHHHVIMENEHVRVFEVLASPGATSPMHTHPPTVAISLGKARYRMTGLDGAPYIMDLNPTQVLWIEDAEHSWELLSGQAHVIGIEIKSAQRGETPAAVPESPTNAVVVDPTHHHVIMENEHVRVFEALASPGATSPTHTHPATVVVSFAQARLAMTAGGSTEIVDQGPAQVFWVEDVEHSWELLSGEIHVVAVEIKSGAP